MTTTENPYTYIYYDPETMIPFYVGKGTNNRAYIHLTESLEKTDNPEKVKEIQRISETGLKPIIKICYKETEDEAFELEEFLTYHWGLRHKGGILTNIIYGGKNGNFVGIEGLPKSEEHKKKISQAMLGNTYAKAQKGKHKSQKACQKMSESKKKLYQEHPELHPRLGKKQSKHSIEVSKECNSNIWEITYPDGHLETIKNLKQFCKKHSINNGNLVAIGRASGYKAVNLNPKPNKKKNQKTKDAISQARAKKYNIIFPDGHNEIIINFSKWCKEHNLIKSNFYCGGNTKGFKATKISE